MRIQKQSRGQSQKRKRRQRPMLKHTTVVEEEVDTIIMAKGITIFL